MSGTYRRTRRALTNERDELRYIIEYHQRKYAEAIARLAVVERELAEYEAEETEAAAE